MLTEKDYCDCETCIALEELGIVDCSLQYYERGCPNTLHRNLLQPLTIRTAEVLGRVLAISLYNAQKFLRKEKHIEVVVLSRGMIWAPYYFQVYTEDCVIADDKDYASFEEALLEGIKEAVKLLKGEGK